jgi:hypothetical protein
MLWLDCTPFVAAGPRSVFVETNRRVANRFGDLNPADRHSEALTMSGTRNLYLAAAGRRGESAFSLGARTQRPGPGGPPALLTLSFSPVILRAPKIGSKNLSSVYCGKYVEK